MSGTVKQIEARLLRRVPRHEPELEELAADDVERRVVHLDELPAGAHEREGLVLRGEDGVVDGELVGGKAPAGRIGSRDVGGVALDLRADVGQEQAAAHDRIVIALVMQGRRVSSRGDDRRKRPAARAEVAKSEFDRGLDLALARRREDASHRRLLCLGRDVHGALDQGELGRALDFAHRVEQRRGVAELHLRIAPPHLVRELLLARQGRRAGAVLEDEPHLGTPAPHGGEERRHSRRRIVAVRRRDGAPPAALHQQVDEVVELPGRRHLREAAGCRDFVPRHDPAGPRLGGRIAIAREDQLVVIALAREQDEGRVGLVHPGQIQKVVFLTERPVDVAGTARGQGRERNEHRVGADGFRQRRSPRLKLRGGHTRALCRRVGREDRDCRDEREREPHVVPPAVSLYAAARPARLRSASLRARSSAG